MSTSTLRSLLLVGVMSTFPMGFAHSQTAPSGDGRTNAPTETDDAPRTDVGRTDLEQGQETATAARLKETFRVFGVEPHELSLVQDSTPLSIAEVELLSRLLRVLTRLDWTTRQSWQQPLDDWKSLSDEVEKRRWQLYSLQGRVGRIQPWPDPTESQAADSTRRPLYALELQHVSDANRVTLLTRSLPKSWQPDRAPEQAVIRCDAVLVKTSGQADSPRPVLISDQIRWYPQQADATRGVTDGAALLGQYGFDFGQLASVIQRGKLTEADRQCFYEMLWTTRRVPPSTIARRAGSQSLPMAQLLQAPETLKASLFRLRGTARRVVKIRVTDTEVRQRYGIDHYYEVEMFVPLEPSLRLIDAIDGSERVYHRYPVTICCSALPTSMPQGDVIRQEIEVDAFLMKLWSYRSVFASGDEKDREKRQISPLMIAHGVRIATPQQQRNELPALLLACVVVGTVAIAFTLRTVYARGDSKFARWRRRQRQDQPVSFDDVDRFDKSLDVKSDE